MILPSPTRLPFKTTKTFFFFALHLQLKNISCKFQNFKIPPLQVAPLLIIVTRGRYCPLWKTLVQTKDSQTFFNTFISFLWEAPLRRNKKAMATSDNTSQKTAFKNAKTFLLLLTFFDQNIYCKFLFFALWLPLLQLMAPKFLKISNVYLGFKTTLKYS